MIKLSRYGALAGILALAGCSTVAQAPATSNITPQDLGFITTAYQLVHFDLAACAYVQKGGLTPTVVPVANKICADAAKYAPQIQAQAKANGVTLPGTLPLDLKAQLVALSYHPSPSLSVAFLRDEISSHESAIAVFQDEARNGTSPEFKQVAIETTPLLEQNLDMLRDALPKNMGE
ncbi:putative membrane protein [Acidiphilium sp. MT5]